MSKPSPSIGIITAAYNSGFLFKDYIEGLRKQTLKPNSICYVDDSSTDESVSIILDYLNKYNIEYSTTINESSIFKEIYGTMIDNIKFLLCVRKENGGPAAARNNAIDCLNTDLYCVCDSDDVFYPDKIAESVDIFRRFPHTSLVYSDYNTLNTRTGIEIREYKEPFSYVRLCQECIVSNNSMFSKLALEKCGRYDENIRGPEDYDLWLRLAEVGAVYHIPKALYQYRLGENNLTISTSKQEFASQVRKVYKKLAERQSRDKAQ